MRSLIFVIVVFFSTFIFISCGGEEPNVPDDEFITDEVMDETADETVDSEQPDIEPVCEDGERMCSSFDNARHILICVDGFWQSERDCYNIAVPTEYYCRQGWDENFYCNDNEIPADPSFILLNSLGECQDSACKNLCLLQWDEQTGERIYLYELNGNGSISISYSIFSLETSHNKCYVNSGVPFNWERLLSDSFPIKLKKESQNLNGKFQVITILEETDEFFEEKKKFRVLAYSSCINESGNNFCEEKEIESSFIEDIEGPVYKTADSYLVPAKK